MYKSIAEIDLNCTADSRNFVDVAVILGSRGCVTGVYNWWETCEGPGKKRTKEGVPNYGNRTTAYLDGMSDGDVVAIVISG